MSEDQGFKVSELITEDGTCYSTTAYVSLPALHLTDVATVRRLADWLQEITPKESQNESKQPPRGGGVMGKQYSFDEKCLELARHFYPDAPKEYLDQLAQEFQDCVEGRDPPDTRFCYGAMCTWFGSIYEIGKRGDLPCCPCCKGMLFEMPTEEQWWSGVDRHEREKPHQGYRSMLEWQRAQNRCFTMREGAFQALESAYKNSFDKKEPTA